MNVHAESWDGKGGIGQVGCRRFEIVAENTEEAMVLANVAASLIQAIRENGKVEEENLVYAEDMPS